MGKCFSYSQTPVEFIPVYGSQSFSFDKYYSLNKTDSVKIENLKFYISALEFFDEEKLVFSEKESFHLIDLSKSEKLKFQLKTQSDIKFTHIRFNVGIDSITNVSGALGGDLDPTLGMYWTWQSGYINVKIEGKSNLCKTRLNEFGLHLGGYTTPNLSLQTIQLKVNSQSTLKIFLDVKLFLESIDLEKQNQIMSPGLAAVSLSKIFTDIFSCK